MLTSWTSQPSGRRSSRSTGRSSASSSASRGRSPATATRRLRPSRRGSPTCSAAPTSGPRSGPLEAWVWRCVVNRARKARRRPLLEPPVDEQRIDGDHDHSQLVDRLAALPERQRLVVFLRYFADLEYREIGETLGIETGTVSATLHAAHAALRAERQEATA